ncbi:MAG: hypothetical protein K5675_09355, partial [Lachnospiraceae bacterium]|nr:hypothetical protein [Lachnospiraceae bacterium]
MRIGILSQFRERSLSGIPKVVAGTVSELKKLTVQDDLLYMGEEPFLPVQLPFVDIPYAGWEKYHLDFCLHGNDMDVLHSFYYAFHYDNPRCKKILTIHDLIHVAHPEWFFKTSNDYFSGPLKECAKKV